MLSPFLTVTTAIDRVPFDWATLSTDLFCYSLSQAAPEGLKEKKTNNIYTYPCTPLFLTWQTSTCGRVQPPLANLDL